MLQIGMISFTNAAPFRLVPPEFPVAWTMGDPATLAKKMAEGALDACLLPIGALPALGRTVTPLGPYGIACCGHVLSLRVYSQIPLRKLIEERKKLYITPRTRTTRLLVSELFAMQYGSRPIVTDDAHRAEARLLIGDEAMDLSREEFRWPIARDVSEWWFDQTGLGFVFAQWMIAKHVDASSIEALQSWLETNLQHAATADGQSALRIEGQRAGWSAALTDLYFERLDYRLRDTHLQGMAEFWKRIEGDKDAD